MTRLQTVDNFMTPLQFVGELNLKPYPDGVHWQLITDFTFCDGDGTLYTAPAGLVTDFASIPALNRIGMTIMVLAHIASRFHWSGHLLAAFGVWVIWIASDLRPWGRYGPAAIIHDALFASQTTSFWTANMVLWRAMKITNTARWERIVIFGGVMLGGYFAWLQDGRRLKKGMRRGFPVKISRPQ